MPLERPSLDELLSRVRADFASRLGLGALVPRGTLSGLASAHAGAVHAAYGFVEHASRQFFPELADPEYLERFGALFGITRKAATFAAGDLTFTGGTGSTIPAATEVSRADGQRYATDAAATLSAGTATVAATATSAGVAGNADAATSLELTSPVSGVDNDVVVAAGGLSGGADRETDADLLARILQRVQNPPQGGAAADYVGWALEVAGVTRAWALPEHLGDGTVGVTFAVDNDPSGPIPSAAQVAAVDAYIQDPARKPVPAAVTVFAPAARTVDVSISLFQVDTTEVRQAIEQSLVELLRRIGAPGVDLLVSEVRAAISNAPGEVDHVLNNPTSNVSVAAGELPVLGNLTWP